MLTSASFSPYQGWLVLLLHPGRSSCVLWREAFVTEQPMARIPRSSQRHMSAEDEHCISAFPPASSWTAEEKQLGDGVTDLVSCNMDIFPSSHGVPARNLAFSYMFSSKTSQRLVHRSSVLRVPHANKSLKHLHSKGPSTIHFSCRQCQLTIIWPIWLSSSIPTSKGSHCLWLHLPRLSRALQSQHSGSALIQSQPHSKTFKNLNKIPAWTTQTHIHIWILTSVPQVFSVLKFSLLYSQPHIRPT